MARRARKRTGRRRPRAGEAAASLAAAWTAFERTCEERLSSIGSQLEAVAGFISCSAAKLEGLENRVEVVVAKKLLETEARLAGWIDRVVERRLARAGTQDPTALGPIPAELRRLEAMTAKIEGLLSLLDQGPPPVSHQDEHTPHARDAEPA